MTEGFQLNLSAMHLELQNTVKATRLTHVNCFIK